MKSNLKKKMALLGLTVVMGMTIVACGNKTEEVPETEVMAETEVQTAAEESSVAEETEETTQAQEGVLSEEEYMDKAEAIMTTIGEAMTNVQTELTTMDQTDVEGIKEYITNMQTPFIEFAQLQAPEKYAPAQEKFKSGCEAMVSYLDLCVQMMDPEAMKDADQAELTTQLTELLTTVQNDLLEGSALIDATLGGTTETTEE